LVLVYVHKTLYNMRMVAISLFLAFIYVLLICCGIILLGYKVNMITIKSQICMQTLNLTMYDQWPAQGHGITQFVASLKSQDDSNDIKLQIYQLSIAINTAYSVY